MNDKETRRVNKWSVGDSASVERTVTEEVIDLFAVVSGDYNTIHFDDDYAASTIFGKRIAHGLFCLSLISYLIGVKLPGDGAVFLNENLKYTAPVYLGDSITAKVEIIDVDYQKSNLLMELSCKNQNGRTCLSGTTLVKVL